MIKYKTSKALLDRRSQLRVEITQLRARSYEELYAKLSELFKIEQKLNKKYTMRQLAIDTDFNEQFVYKILSWRKASQYVRGEVKNERITMIKVCRILHKIPIFKQNETIAYIIKNQLNEGEMDKYITKYKTKKAELLQSREYKHKWNIVRDILTLSTKMTRCLLAADKIPKNQKIKVLESLKIHKEHVDTAIEKLMEEKYEKYDKEKKDK